MPKIKKLDCPLSKFLVQNVLGLLSCTRFLYLGSAIILMFTGATGFFLEYVRSPALCHKGDGVVISEAINSYCWIHALPFKYEISDWRQGPQPGILEKTQTGLDSDADQGIQLYFHSFSLSALVFFAGFACYTAKVNRISQFLSRLSKDDRRRLPRIPPPVATLDIELFNFTIVVLHLVFLNRLVENQLGPFSTDISKVVAKLSYQRSDPLSKLFPKETSCKIYTPGRFLPTIETRCFLPINVFYEKAYIFIWFWLVTVATLAGVVLLYKMTVFLLFLNEGEEDKSMRILRSEEIEMRLQSLYQNQC